MFFKKILYQNKNDDVKEKYCIIEQEIDEKH